MYKAIKANRVVDIPESKAESYLAEGYSIFKGFLYLAYALTLCMQDESYLLSIYTRLYADVGKHYNVNRDNVEHCLRTVVSTCWDKGDRKFLIKISGYNMTQKPTNGEFIDILYHYLTLHEEISL